MRDESGYLVESADNVLRLLELLAQRGRLRVSEASDELGVARSTAHRLLITLRHRGFAVQDSHKVYRPGPAFERMVRPGPSPLDLRAALHIHLAELSQGLGETCHLMVLEGNGTRFLDCVESTQILRVGARTGMLLPAHVTSGGKALLAELSKEQFTALYPRDLPALPGSGTVNRAALLQQLTGIRRRGYATNYGESDRGIVAIGACVRDGSGRALAAFAVALPSPRCPRSRIPELAKAIEEHCRRASADL
ncbi:IclR family transcriptional regulator [Amycolatopsis sp. NPDC049253]|uniref:IclR family transcriptional regulator n=1 Tax=Amycolatopsis sp. NPDC049253 TaxID=3155274 RepID=UPI0034296008